MSIMYRNDKSNRQGSCNVSGLFMLLLPYLTLLGVFTTPQLNPFSVLYLPFLSANSYQVSQTCQSTVIQNISLPLCSARLGKTGRMQPCCITVFLDYNMPVCPSKLCIYGFVVGFERNTGCQHKHE